MNSDFPVLNDKVKNLWSVNKGQVTALHYICSEESIMVEFREERIVKRWWHWKDKVEPAGFYDLLMMRYMGETVPDGYLFGKDKKVRTMYKVVIETANGDISRLFTTEKEALYYYAKLTREFGLSCVDTIEWPVVEEWARKAEYILEHNRLPDGD